MIRTISVVWIITAVMAGQVRAQSEPAPPEEPASTPKEPDSTEEEPVLSPEEQRELEEALAGDQAEREEQEHDHDASSSSSSSSVVGRAVGALQSMNPQISVVTNVAFAAFSEDENLNAGAHDPTENGFNLQQLELAIGAAVDPYFRVDGNIVFGGFGVEIEEIYATTLSLPWNLQVRAGQFLTRFGRINSTHAHSWDFVDQPMQMSRVFGGEGNRGLGVELSWLTPLPWYVEVVGSAINPSGDCCARSFLTGDDLMVERATDLEGVFAVKQFFELNPDWSLMWGLSLAVGPNSTGNNNRTDIFGTDLYLKWRPLTGSSFTEVALQVEGMYRQRQIPGDRLSDWGGYAELTWRFAQNLKAGGRYEYGSPAETTDGTRGMDPLDPDWTDHRQRAALLFSYVPTEFSRIRLQGSVDDPKWLPNKIFSTFLAVEFNIGAHGAHRF